MIYSTDGIGWFSPNPAWHYKTLTQQLLKIKDIDLGRWQTDPGFEHHELAATSTCTHMLGGRGVGGSKEIQIWYRNKTTCGCNVRCQRNTDEDTLCLGD